MIWVFVIPGPVGFRVYVGKTAALPIMMVPRGRRAIAQAWVLETGG